MYIYDMPYGKRLDLEIALDIDNQWKQLAAQIPTLSQDDVAYIGLAINRQGGSPTGDLLTKWGQSNATVMELFHCLKNAKLFKALNILRGVVPDEYFNETPRRRPPPPPATGVFTLRTQLKSQTNGSDSEMSLPSNPDLWPQQGRECANYANMNSHDGYPPHGTPLPGYQSIQSLSSQKPYAANQYSGKQPQKPSPHPFQNGPNRHPTESYCSTSLSGHLSNGDHGNLQNENAVNLAMKSMPKFTYDELANATNYFMSEKEIGQGGFGTVYKAFVDRLKTECAVKRLKNPVFKELETLFKCRHENIIMLLGFCEHPNAMCLVYALMPNGSLEDRLLCKDNTPPLTWLQRMNILAGASCGIYYLHSLDQPIIHGDIKSANILLDAHFTAKISDFGLARQFLQEPSGEKTHYTHVSKPIYGTCHYLPQEYIEDPTKLRKPVDVFSFGMVIFETCTGVKASDASALIPGKHKKTLKDILEDYRNVTDYSMLMSKLCDVRCKDWPHYLWSDIYQSAQKCTVTSPSRRPQMSEITESLFRLLNTSKEAAKWKGDHQVQANKPRSEYSVHMSYTSEGEGVGLLHANKPSLHPSEKSSYKTQLSDITSSSVLAGKGSQKAEEKDDDDDDYIHTTPSHPIHKKNKQCVSISPMQLSKTNDDICSYKDVASKDLNEKADSGNYAEIPQESDSDLLDTKKTFTSKSAQFESELDEEEQAIIHSQLHQTSEAWILQDMYDKQPEAAVNSDEAPLLKKKTRVFGGYRSKVADNGLAHDESERDMAAAAILDHGYLCGIADIDDTSCGIYSSQFNGVIKQNKIQKNEYHNPPARRPNKCFPPPVTEARPNRNDSLNKEFSVKELSGALPNFPSCSEYKFSPSRDDIEDKKGSGMTSVTNISKPISTFYLATESDSDNGLSLHKKKDNMRYIPVKGALDGEIIAHDSGNFLYRPPINTEEMIIQKKNKTLPSVLQSNFEGNTTRQCIHSESDFNGDQLLPYEMETVSLSNGQINSDPVHSLQTNINSLPKMHSYSGHYVNVMQNRPVQRRHDMENPDYSH